MPRFRSARQRPAKKDTRKREALKGRNPLLSTAAALSGLSHPCGTFRTLRPLVCFVFYEYITETRPKLFFVSTLSLFYSHFILVLLLLLHCYFSIFAHR
jgi:hypothetical protein